MWEMGQKEKRALTREKMLGMQVINSKGYIIGKVKNLSLVVGEPEQALIIEDEQGNETEVLWNEVSAGGDVILLKPEEEVKPEEKQTAPPTHCPSCGAELEDGALFCPECGTKIK
jgi:sporulation protein YlmC with PRC-barrel domain